jgi:dipeptidase
MRNIDYVRTRRKLSILAIAVTMFFALCACRDVAACTTILVGKALTADGSVILGHNEDMGLTATGRLWSQQARSFKESVRIEVPYVNLQQPHRIHAYWASGNPKGSVGLGTSTQHRPYDSVLVGMNQWGVAMACNWAHSKEEAAQKKGIRRYAIRQLILERCTTAREAVNLIGNLIDEHGQADWGGLIYNVADPNEAWMVETTTHHWAARRVPDDAIHAVANQFTIGDDFDLASQDLAQFAETRGWYDPRHGKLSFRDAYGLPEKMNQPYDIDREARIHKLLDGKRGFIEPTDIFVVLRDRYEGTDKYTSPQQTPVWREDIDKDPSLSRTINSNLCQSSSVAQLRGNLPVEVGAIMWYAMANPDYSNYFPIYAGANRIPEAFSRQDGKRSPDSAWWLFKSLQLAGDRNYESLSPLVNNFWTAHHASATLQQQRVEDKAISLIRDGRKDEAVALLRTFTSNQAQDALKHAQQLLELQKPVREGTVVEQHKAATHQ